MEAVLKFNLENLTDLDLYKKCNKSSEYFEALKETREHFRKIVRDKDLIKPNDSIALPEGWHTITEEESVLLHHIVDIVFFRFLSTLKQKGIILDE